MNQEEKQLHAAIQEAFADRSMPAGRLIEKGVDLDYHEEARRVDAYFRKHKAVIDRHNSVLYAFTYMNTEASFWLLPLYINSILTDYRRDDHLIDVFFEVLAGGVSPYKRLSGERDLDLRKLATDEEAAVVCHFCRWLKHKQDLSAIIDEFSDAAIDVRCTRPPVTGTSR